MMSVLHKLASKGGQNGFEKCVERESESFPIEAVIEG